MRLSDTSTALICLVALSGAESRSRQSVGFVSGSIQGRTDLAAEAGEQARFFVRRDLGLRWSAEGGGGFGRLKGESFATDMGLIDVKLLFRPCASRRGRYTPAPESAWSSTALSGYRPRRLVSIEKVGVLPSLRGWVCSCACATAWRWNSPPVTPTRCATILKEPPQIKETTDSGTPASVWS